MNIAPDAASRTDDRLLDDLRRRDQSAYATLVERYHGAMVRLARIYVSSRDVAEEVAQDAWLGVLQGLERFEGRSSLRTWLFRILVYQAKSRQHREWRTIPFSAVADPVRDRAEIAVDPDRFLPADDPSWPHHWASPPASWEGIPEERLISRETREVVQAAIDDLPASQRAVITMRDVVGWSSDEVCNALEISETNQRVLLHRARSKVRRALERYLDEEEVRGR